MRPAVKQPNGTAHWARMLGAGQAGDTYGWPIGQAEWTTTVGAEAQRAGLIGGTASLPCMCAGSAGCQAPLGCARGLQAT